MAVAVGPEQGRQVDAPDDCVVLAGPVPGDQVDRLGIRFVERRIVDDQHAAGAVDQGPGFLPEGLRVGLQAEQEPGEGVVGWGIAGLRLHLGGLHAGEELGTGDDEVDVVNGGAFRLWRVHLGHHGLLSPSAKSGRLTIIA